MSPSAPGPDAELIDYAAGVIVRSRKQPHTAPYDWARALREEGMLVPPGAAHRLVPSEAFVVPLEDPNDFVPVEKVRQLQRWVARQLADPRASRRSPLDVLMDVATYLAAVLPGGPS